MYRYCISLPKFKFTSNQYFFLYHDCVSALRKSHFQDYFRARSAASVLYSFSCNCLSTSLLLCLLHLTYIRYSTLHFCSVVSLYPSYHFLSLSLPLSHDPSFISFYSVSLHLCPSHTLHRQFRFEFYFIFSSPHSLSYSLLTNNCIGPKAESKGERYDKTSATRDE